MDIITLFTLAVGLSMDAFAVSVCKGLATEKLAPKHMILAGLWFGGFQALMPVIGYFLGSQFKDKITSIDHWIAFFLLGFIGINMIRESREKDDSCPVGGMEAKKMFPLAVATSIDALAVGITFAFLEVNIILAASFIGIITFILSATGIQIKSRTGRGNHPHPPWNQNPPGTPGNLLKMYIYKPCKTILTREKGQCQRLLTDKIVIFRYNKGEDSRWILD